MPIGSPRYLQKGEETQALMPGPQCTLEPTNPNYGQWFQGSKGRYWVPYNLPAWQGLGEWRHNEDGPFWVPFVQYA